MVDNLQISQEMSPEKIAAYEKARRRLNVILTPMHLFTPLYAIVFESLKFIPTEDIQTMAVGPIQRVNMGLYYNPYFVATLTDEEVTAVLQHEALHVLLHHIPRAAAYSYVHKGFNYAADLAINTNIKNLPKSALLPSLFGFPPDLSADKYYALLKQAASDAGKELDDFLQGSSGDLVDDHSLWGDCDEEVIKEKIRGIAGSAIKAQEKKGWGEFSGNLVQEIIAANKHVVNWKREVRYFVNKMVKLGARSTRLRINRREQSLIDERPNALKDIYFSPGRMKEYTSRLLIALDTSGSVSDAELRMFVTEMNGIVSNVICDYICFDHSLQFDKPKKFDKKANSVEVKGRGGTNFDPIVRMFEELNYDGLIIMTDGEAPFPVPPRNKRVMWCLTPSGENINIPWGKKVVIKKN
jgi:predicted metal-dependent peptidase